MIEFDDYMEQDDELQSIETESGYEDYCDFYGDSFPN